MATTDGAGGEPGKAAERSSGLLGFIVAMLVATVVAGVGGGIFGMYGIAATGGAESKAEKPDEKAKAPFGPGLNMKPLSPIITNLAEPRGTWIRLEAAVVLEGVPQKEENVLVGRVGEDIVAFLRTVSLAQIEGANGFQHLREDLTERARLRSGGSVRELVIQSLVVE
ncbi:MAG: flagellar basal body-associated FliL family protein [Bacteroidota bacterium]|jgi:flagellar FliL protein